MIIRVLLARDRRAWIVDRTREVGGCPRRRRARGRRCARAPRGGGAAAARTTARLNRRTREDARCVRRLGVA